MFTSNDPVDSRRRNRIINFHEISLVRSVPIVFSTEINWSWKIVVVEQKLHLISLNNRTESLFWVCESHFVKFLWSPANWRYEILTQFPQFHFPLSMLYQCFRELSQEKLSWQLWKLFQFFSFSSLFAFILWLNQKFSSVFLVLESANGEKLEEIRESFSRMMRRVYKQRQDSEFISIRKENKPRRASRIATRLK